LYFAGQAPRARCLFYRLASLADSSPADKKGSKGRHARASSLGSLRSPTRLSAYTSPRANGVTAGGRGGAMGGGGPEEGNAGQTLGLLFHCETGSARPEAEKCSLDLRRVTDLYYGCDSPLSPHLTPHPLLSSTTAVTLSHTIHYSLIS
jgi:hypothetical protein